MLIKSADSKDPDSAMLERLLDEAPADKRALIHEYLRTLRAGLKAEQDAQYLIDFTYQPSDRFVVLHDLRLHDGERHAQIDHLLIHRTLHVFVLESKHFNAGIKITPQREFLQWNVYRHRYEGIPSPIEQNARHLSVVERVFRELKLPSRMGIRLRPVFQSFVLVSNNARIIRPQGVNTDEVIKVDALTSTISQEFDKLSVPDTIGHLARVVSEEALRNIGQQVLARHQPIVINYQAKFGMTQPSRLSTGAHPTSNPIQTNDAADPPRCGRCRSTQLVVQHGRYGYYFKCGVCGGNTRITMECGHVGHHERIRKVKQKFFRDCADCGTSQLFFVNPAE